MFLMNVFREVPENGTLRALDFKYMKEIVKGTHEYRKHDIKPKLTWVSFYTYV